jgi:uncharacterized membrane protein YdbT with pleckstrin-like domain
MTWVGKPDARPYLLSRCISLLGSVVFVALVYAVCYAIKETEKTGINWFGIHVFGIMIFGQALYSNVRKMIKYQTLVYEVSNDWIKIKRGKDGKEVKHIDRNMIQFVESTTTFSDKIFGTQTVRIYTGELQERNDRIRKKFDELENIKDYEVTQSILTAAGLGKKM